MVTFFFMPKVLAAFPGLRCPVSGRSSPWPIHSRRRGQCWARAVLWGLFPAESLLKLVWVLRETWGSWEPLIAQLAREAAPLMLGGSWGETTRATGTQLNCGLT